MLLWPQHTFDFSEQIGPCERLLQARNRIEVALQGKWISPNLAAATSNTRRVLRVLDRKNSRVACP